MTAAKKKEKKKTKKARKKEPYHSGLEKHHESSGGYLKSTVFGFNDGLVSTLGIIAGLIGGAVSSPIIILAGLAEIFAGAFSMSLGDYISTKSELELYQAERKREKYEVKHVPEEEKNEVRQIYAAKGFKGELLDKVVEQITSDEDVWIDTMMKEELGLTQTQVGAPRKAAVFMGVSYTVAGFIPLLPFFFLPPEEAWIPTMFMSVIGLFVAGAAKTNVTKKNWLYSGAENLVIGLIAAAVGYGVGVLVSPLLVGL